jgi:hypothetical protein
MAPRNQGLPADLNTCSLAKDAVAKSFGSLNSVHILTSSKRHPLSLYDCNSTGLQEKNIYLFAFQVNTLYTRFIVVNHGECLPKFRYMGRAWSTTHAAM